MGLFESKKKEQLPGISDVFSAEDLQRLREVICPKRDNRGYGRYGDVADTLLQVVETPDKEFTKREWNGIIYAAGAMVKIEPELAPVLRKCIDRFHAFRK